MRSQSRLEEIRKNEPKSNQLNAIKHHVLVGAELLLPSENPEAYNLFRTALFEEFDPETPYECVLIDSIVNCTWKLRRIEFAIRDLFTDHGAIGTNDFLSPATQAILASLDRHLGQLTRTKDNHHKLFRTLKKEREQILQNEPKVPSQPHRSANPEQTLHLEPFLNPTIEVPVERPAEAAVETPAKPRSSEPVEIVTHPQEGEIPVQAIENNPDFQKNQNEPKTESEGPDSVQAIELSSTDKIDKTNPTQQETQISRASLILKLFQIDQRISHIPNFIPDWFDFKFRTALESLKINSDSFNQQQQSQIAQSLLGYLPAFN